MLDPLGTGLSLEDLKTLGGEKHNYQHLDTFRKGVVWFYLSSAARVNSPRTRGSFQLSEFTSWDPNGRRAGVSVDAPH